MSSFTKPLIVEILQKEKKGRGVARVYQEFVYAVGSLENPTELHTVEVGFETDFMSVPAIARSIIPVVGKLAKAAVLHDWLLTNNFNRFYAHRVFREALGVLGANPIEKLVLYWAVRTTAEIKHALGQKLS